MSTTDRMRERIARGVDLGTPCRHCGTTAVECQLIYIESDERTRCCEGCREGARLAHT